MATNLMTTNQSENKQLLEGIDARTRLAGSNKMEILLFSLILRNVRHQCFQGS